MDRWKDPDKYRSVLWDGKSESESGENTTPPYGVRVDAWSGGGINDPGHKKIRGPKRELSRAVMTCRKTSA